VAQKTAKSDRKFRRTLALSSRMAMAREANLHFQEN